MAYGGPTLAQWDQQHLGSTGTQVQSLAMAQWIKDWCCYSCALDPDCGSDLIPGLGIPYASEWLKMERKKESLLVIYSRAAILNLINSKDTAKFLA